MWLKYLISFILFYFFAILQSSFLAHFSLFGAFPNIVFALFFVFVFFDKSQSYYQVIFYAISAGLFLDFLFFSYFGVSISIFLIIGLASKKIHFMLQEKGGDLFPFSYFLPLYFVSLAVYDILNSLILKKFSFPSIFYEIYSLAIASIIFFIYKKIVRPKVDDKQLNLFNKSLFR